ncbi:hypothetical protein EVAR_54757_1 [Eumeta japonica]|uniref:Uncharacterized protein n=1 Tax=Eumeta variegata TaxID=151549 RepID=A0A4C1YD32_EUMVA|nr:hypothetical protein EVAR_54757_1 [Eumeta japonica]
MENAPFNTQPLPPSDDLSAGISARSAYKRSGNTDVDIKGKKQSKRGKCGESVETGAGRDEHRAGRPRAHRRRRSAAAIRIVNYGRRRKQLLEPRKLVIYVS